MLQQEETTWW